MSTPFVSRGFHGRREPSAEAQRLPPGQYLVSGFPVLSAGPTPRTPLDRWDFTIEGEVDQPRRWRWQVFQQLPRETVTKDIHCVTKWSKFDTVWTCGSRRRTATRPSAATPSPPRPPSRACR